jgi:hypothetical protein
VGNRAPKLRLSRGRGSIIIPWRLYPQDFSDFRSLVPQLTSQISPLRYLFFPLKNRRIPPRQNYKWEEKLMMEQGISSILYTSTTSIYIHLKKGDDIFTLKIDGGANRTCLHQDLQRLHKNLSAPRSLISGCNLHTDWEDGKETRLP